MAEMTEHEKFRHDVSVMLRTAQEELDAGRVGIIAVVFVNPMGDAASHNFAGQQNLAIPMIGLLECVKAKMVSVAINTESIANERKPGLRLVKKEDSSV